MAATFLPETVPVLTGNDIARRTLHSKDGTQHCLMGWIRVVCPEHQDTNSEIYFALGDEAGTRRPGCTAVSLFNDDQRNSLDDVADVWNATFEKRLGYVRRGKQFILPKKASK
jgi:hypothetical protein